MSNIVQKAADYANAKFNPEKHLENVPNFYCIDLYEAFLAGYKVLQKEYEEKLRWIPVEEELPEIGQRVLLKNEFYEYVGFLSKNKKDFRALTVEISDSNEKIPGVTHWRSL